MKGVSRPPAAGALKTQELQLPTGTIVTEYVDSTGQVYAVSWHGPILPDLHQLLGTYFPSYQLAARTPVIRHRLVRLNTSDIVIESSGRLRAFVGRAWVPALLPTGVTAADIH